ncbi:basic proline-rich protein-like [Strigops habroptila]|uniref:basic proline-rich protein-like n=1 Tax=Strigops habroptila TaxID=2489341 RepID=UPI0011CFBC3F|nr:basic proline-rich protein-like [Strigops habroptila]
MNPVSVTKMKRHPKNPSQQANRKVFSGSSGTSRRCALSQPRASPAPRYRRQTRYLRPPFPGWVREDGPPAAVPGQGWPGASVAATTLPKANARPRAAPAGPGRDGERGPAAPRPSGRDREGRGGAAALRPGACCAPRSVHGSGRGPGKFAPVVACERQSWRRTEPGGRHRDRHSPSPPGDPDPPRSPLSPQALPPPRRDGGPGKAPAALRFIAALRPAPGSPAPPGSLQIAAAPPPPPQQQQHPVPAAERRLPPGAPPHPQGELPPRRRRARRAAGAALTPIRPAGHRPRRVVPGCKAARR